MARTYPDDTPRTALGEQGKLGLLVARLWDQLRRLADSDPKPHSLSHLVGGSDQFPKPGTPKTVLRDTDNAAAVGVGPGFMRADAQLVFTPATTVQVAGEEIGTRNALDFEDNDSVSWDITDDPDGETIVVTAKAKDRSLRKLTMLLLVELRKKQIIVLDGSAHGLLARLLLVLEEINAKL